MKKKLMIGIIPSLIALAGCNSLQTKHNAGVGDLWLDAAQKTSQVQEISSQNNPKNEALPSLWDGINKEGYKQNITNIISITNKALPDLWDGINKDGYKQNITNIISTTNAEDNDCKNIVGKYHTMIDNFVRSVEEANIEVKDLNKFKEMSDVIIKDYGRLTEFRYNENYEDCFGLGDPKERELTAAYNNFIDRINKRIEKHKKSR